jgi:hypothetical protein
MLFYHVKLRCYVVIELKGRAFKPEYAGKLNFYLSAVDDLLRNETDQPTVGILMCKSKNDRALGRCHTNREDTPGKVPPGKVPYESRRHHVRNPDTRRFRPR